jgi:hypothetical protein
MTKYGCGLVVSTIRDRREGFKRQGQGENRDVFVKRGFL